MMHSHLRHQRPKEHREYVTFRVRKRTWNNIHLLVSFTKSQHQKCEFGVGELFSTYFLILASLL
jgi:hypothetical protein